MVLDTTSLERRIFTICKLGKSIPAIPRPKWQRYNSSSYGPGTVRSTLLSKLTSIIMSEESQDSHFTNAETNSQEVPQSRRQQGGGAAEPPCSRPSSGLCFPRRPPHGTAGTSWAPLEGSTPHASLRPAQGPSEVRTITATVQVTNKQDVQKSFRCHEMLSRHQSSIGRKAT